LRDDRERFERAGAGVVLIGLGRPDQAGWFCRSRDIPFPCVVRPDRGAHRAYGLRRGTLNDVAGPRVWAPWLKNMVTGNPQGRFGQGDPVQLPGTFVVDTDGVIRYVHRGRRSSDIAPNDEVLDALERVRAGKEGP
jgi:peroxiredoxin